MKNTNHELRDQFIEFVIKFTNDNGYPPAIRDFITYLPFKSKSHVDYYIKQLYKDGLITYEKGKRRTIKVLGYSPYDRIKELEQEVATLKNIIANLENKQKYERNFK